MEEAYGINHFARIPDDLLLLILNRLEDLKQLCGCALVSKRFALTTYQIKSVSLTLPSTEIYSTASADKLNELFVNPAGLTSEEIIRFIQSSSIKELKFISFLQNFRQLRSISLDFTCPGSVACSTHFRVGVIFRGGGAVVENFDKETGEMYEPEVMYERERRKQSIPGTSIPIGCCTNWLLVLCLLIKCQPLLLDVTISNCKNQGYLYLRNRQHIVWKNSLIPSDFTPYARALGATCDMYSRGSYQLKGADYMMVIYDYESYSYSGSDSDSGDYIEPIDWEYSEEDKLLHRAMDEFGRQYGDPFTFAD